MRERCKAPGNGSATELEIVPREELGIVLFVFYNLWYAMAYNAIVKNRWRDFWMCETERSEVINSADMVCLIL